MTEPWERWTVLWWQTLPLRGGRLGAWVRRALADGLYLAAWPKAGALLPPGCLVVGFLAGWLHPGFPQIYTESAVFLVLAGVAGAASAHLGLALTVGYALGDFFLHGSTFRDVYGAGLPRGPALVCGMLLAYFTLAQLTVFMPLIASGARRLARLPRPEVLALRLMLEMGVYGLLCAGAAYLWTVVTPVLIRPAFTWWGSLPPASAMQVLQTRGEWLALIVGLAAAGRVALEALAMRSPDGHRRIVTYVVRLRAHPPEVGGRLSPNVKAVVSAGFTTLLMAGALTSWLDALWLGTFFLLINLLRQGRLLRLPSRWIWNMGRIPVALRVLVAGAVTWLAARWILSWFWTHGGNTFRPVVLTVVIAAMVTYLLWPPGSTTVRAAGEAGSR
jgi:hypothetical protein